MSGLFGATETGGLREPRRTPEPDARISSGCVMVLVAAVLGIRHAGAEGSSGGVPQPRRPPARAGGSSGCSRRPDGKRNSTTSPRWTCRPGPSHGDLIEHRSFLLWRDRRVATFPSSRTRAARHLTCAARTAPRGGRRAPLRSTDSGQECRDRRGSARESGRDGCPGRKAAKGMGVANGARSRVKEGMRNDAPRPARKRGGIKGVRQRRPWSG